MEGHEFKVLRADRRRIDQLRVTTPNRCRAPGDARAPSDGRSGSDRGSCATGAWLAALAGAATTLAFAPYGYSRSQSSGRRFLFLLWDDAHAAPGGAHPALPGVRGSFVAGTWWIYTAIHDFGRRAGLARGAAVARCRSRSWARTTRCSAGSPRASVDRPRAVHCLLLLPAGWTLMEWLRGWLFTGFPWLELGYAHSDSPLAALAPIGRHPPGHSAIAVTAGALSRDTEGRLARARHRARRPCRDLGRQLGPCRAAMDGADRRSQSPSRCCRARFPQDEKWQAENRAATLERYRALNREALGARMIVWPESALPMLAHEAAVYLASIRAEARAQRFRRADRPAALRLRDAARSAMACSR